MSKTWPLLLVATAAIFQNAANAAITLQNAGFEAPVCAGGPCTVFNGGAGLFWKTTNTGEIMEQWNAAAGAQYAGGATAFEGSQWMELNADQAAALYQDLAGVAQGTPLGFQFAHRGRSGTDVMKLRVIDSGADQLFGTADDADLFSQDYSTGTAWVQYTNAAPISATGNPLRFWFEAVSSSGGPTYGNWLDDVRFGEGVGVVPPPPPAEVAFASFNGEAEKEALKKGRAEVEFEASVVLGVGNNGLNLVADQVDFSIVNYVLTVPAGSLQPSLARPGVWAFKRTLAGGIKESVSVNFQDDITYKVEVEVEAPATVLQSIAPRQTVTATLAIGDDVGTTSVRVNR